MNFTILAYLRDSAVDRYNLRCIQRVETNVHSLFAVGQVIIGLGGVRVGKGCLHRVVLSSTRRIFLSQPLARESNQRKLGFAHPLLAVCFCTKFRSMLTGVRFWRKSIRIRTRSPADRRLSKIAS